VAAIGDYLHLGNEPATMRISPEEYPQVERHAGDQEVNGSAVPAAAASRAPAGMSMALPCNFSVTSPKLTFMSGVLPNIRLFVAANYFSAA
jgi:hypothetical protein